MIIRPRPNLLQLFFILRGSIVPRIAPQILGLAAYAVLVVWLSRRFGIDFGTGGLAPFTLLGVTLSIYLGFRNNAAFDRWWEARKLWGQMVFDVRNLARAATGLIPAGSSHTRPLLMEALAFCHFLRGSLRAVDVSKDVVGFLGDELASVAGYQNKSDAMLRRMGQRLGELKTSGRIDAMDYRILDERLSTLAALQAGCERIANTPLPFAYMLLLHRSAYLYCFLLPFGLATSLGWLTPLFTAVIAYSFFGLDALSEELEDPFGMEANDLPLDRMCRICEISVFEALGEPAPAAMEAVDYFSS
ncbi:MAG TPA: bestrophin family ion channel [Candidatus Acidoferrum sp.]|nr:bestrophin family ion channel [Candidatus Acidoferrum sp.]